MTDASKEALERVPCIHYSVSFKNTSEAQVQALIDLGSEVNAIHPTFAKQVGLPIRLIDVGAQKIDGTMLETHGMVIAALSVADKENRVRFFEETFLVANVSPKVVLGMLFLTWVVQMLIFQVESSDEERAPPTKPSRLPDASS